MIRFDLVWLFWRENLNEFCHLDEGKIALEIPQRLVKHQTRQVLKTCRVYINKKSQTPTKLEFGILNFQIFLFYKYLSSKTF